MGRPIQSDIVPHVKGDTFKGRGFRITINGSAPVLVGGSCKMQLKLSPSSAAALTLTNGNGMTIDTMVAGRLQIDKQIIDIPAGDYKYDIEITLPTGDVFTWINGSFPIIEDISNG